VLRLAVHSRNGRRPSRARTSVELFLLSALMRACAYTPRTQACTDARTPACMHARTPACMHARTPARMHARMHAQAFAPMHDVLPQVVMGADEIPGSPFTVAVGRASCAERTGAVGGGICGAVAGEPAAFRIQVSAQARTNARTRTRTAGQRPWRRRTGEG
jgi:hypothetical protein